MAKLKTVFVVLLLVLIAGGGAFYGLNRMVEADVIASSQAQLAQAEMLAFDSLRVGAFARIQTLSAEQRNEALATIVARAPTTDNQPDDAIATALKPIHDQLAPLTAELAKKHKLPVLSILSAEGRVLAQTPGEAFGESLKGLPAVKECLAGISRDGLYQLTGNLKQVAVVPLEDTRGKPVGCLMASQVVDNAVASALSKQIGLDVVILAGQTPKAVSLDPEVAKALAPMVKAENPFRFGDPKGPVPLLLDLSKKAFLARAVELPGGTDPVHLAVVVDLGARFGGLQEAQMMILYATGGLLVFGLLLGWLLSSGGVPKQFERLRDSVRLMAEGNGYLLDPDNYSGAYQELARDLRRIAESGRPAQAAVRSPESVSQLLGTRPEPAKMPETDSGSLDFESLLGGGGLQPAKPAPAPTPAPAAPAPPPALAPAVAPVAPPARPAPAPAPPPAQAPGGKGPRVDMPGDLASFFDEGDPEATREVPEAANAWDQLTSEPEPKPPPRPVAPAPKGIRAAPSMPPPPPPPMAGIGFEPPPELDDGGDDDDDQISSSDYRPDATVIAQVPDELLRAAATSSAEPDHRAGYSSVPPPPTALPRPPVSAAMQSRPASPEEAHFHEVFDLFITTKQECGESVAGLTVDKFVEKLRKNSSDLKARYRCKSVKFQVYVKNGKAALKATPIK